MITTYRTFLNLNQIQGYNENKIFPYSFVADEAFALKPYMMRPYPRRCVIDLLERIFNYRLSRARRIIENTFGILVSRFRIFHRPIISNIDHAKFITKAAVALHNFLMKTQSNNVNGNFSYCPPDFVDQDDGSVQIPGQWRREVHDVQGMERINCQGSNNSAREAKEIRNDFKEYFNSGEGSVPWQHKLVNSTTNSFDERY